MASKGPTLAETQIAAAAELSVLDARGNRIRFGALFELETTLVVFIRHFFCASCQQYVSKLTTVDPNTLERAGTKIVIIGCGDWHLINNYRDSTRATRHPLISYYADPTRSVYRALGIATEPPTTPSENMRRRENITLGKVTNVAKSVVCALRSPRHIGKQGNTSQLGGEFILGPQNTCSFAHYMQHTGDHADVRRLFRRVGVAYTSSA